MINERVATPLAQWKVLSHVSPLPNERVGHVFFSPLSPHIFEFDQRFLIMFKTGSRVDIVLGLFFFFFLSGFPPKNEYVGERFPHPIRLPLQLT